MSPKENFENPSKFLEKYCSRAFKKILQEGTLQTKYEEIKVALRLLHSTV